MAISFAESLKIASENIAMADKQIAHLSSESDIESATDRLNYINKQTAVYSSDAENWTLDNKYLFYEDYSDDSISLIDDKKEIQLDSGQINLTQETNSQYIPFEMPRFYDGFDLVNTNLFFHFVNINGYEDFADPINVRYTDSKIRFAWLVDKRVTAVEGKVDFEIQAVGENSKGDEYIWKSKPSGGLNILKSLSGDSDIDPSTLKISAGSSIQPVYFSNGKPVSIAHTIEASIPCCTSDDDGKFLRVANGIATWQTIQNAEDMAF